MIAQPAGAQDHRRECPCAPLGSLSPSAPRSNCCAPPLRAGHREMRRHRPAQTPFARVRQNGARLVRAWVCGHGRRGPEAFKRRGPRASAASSSFWSQAYMNHAPPADANCSAVFAGEAENRLLQARTMSHLSPGPPHACHKKHQCRRGRARPQPLTYGGVCAGPARCRSASTRTARLQPASRCGGRS